MADPAQPGFYASQPVVFIDGSEAHALGSSLLSLLVEETNAGLYRCEARFGNWGPKDGGIGFLWFDRATLDFGKALRIDAGPSGSRKTIFDGRILALEGLFPDSGPPEIAVLAEDRLQDLRMTRKTRTFEDLSDADVVRQIAGDHGLTPEIDADGPTYRALAQLNQSDLAFVRDRGRAIDAEVWVSGKTLHFQTRSRRNDAATAIRLTYGQRLLEFSVLADLAHQRSTVQAAGWDVAAKQSVSFDADESAITSELGGGDRSGASLLRDALGERTERLTMAAPTTQAEADALAKAEFRRRARGFVTGSGVCDGEPDVRVGGTLELGGLGPRFDGKYGVTHVRHTFDRTDGYRTTFEVERPGIGS